MKHIWHHQTKREELLKFLLLLSVLIGYFLYLSWQYDFATGGIVSILTWSFFVLCTPVADAGFLLAFPVRIIAGIRMVFTQAAASIIAVILNIVCIILTPSSYETTFLTSLFYKILTTPWPYWSIIILCAAGTFLSIRFGDEMLDVVSHKERNYHHKHGFKHKIIIMGALFIIIIFAYYHLLEMLNIEIPK